MLCGCFIFIFWYGTVFTVQFEFIALDIGFTASEIYLLKHYFEKSMLNPFLTLDIINYLITFSIFFSLFQISALFSVAP